MTTRPDRSRGVSPVVGTILLVAIVVILAATVGTVVLDQGESVEDPSPLVARSTGEFLPQNGSDGGIVRITHEAGESIRVAELEIVVNAQTACGQTGRLVNLPLDSGDGIDDPNIAGGDVFDERPIDQYADRTGALVEDQWDPSETVLFRIPSSDCAITDGDEIVIEFVHTPTDAVFLSETFTV